MIRPSIGIICLCLFLAIYAILSLLSLQDARVLQVIGAIAAGFASVLLLIGK